jgi:tRNA(adenine34) deaminase
MDETSIIANPELLLPQTVTSKEEQFMLEAMKLAIEAWRQDEVPVGAIVVLDDKIIGRGLNHKEQSHDPTGHAEIQAIKSAALHQKSWRLTGAKLFVTLEPCIMCAGAIIHSRISDVYWATDDPKTGACKSLYNILNDNRLNHQVQSHEGLLRKPCATLLSAFFKAKRLSRK